MFYYSFLIWILLWNYCLEQAREILNQQLKENGNFEALVDPILNGNYDCQEISRMAVIIASSIHTSAKKRPKMSEVRKFMITM